MSDQLTAMFQMLIKPQLQAMTDDEYKAIRSIIVQEMGAEDQRRNLRCGRCIYCAHDQRCPWPDGPPELNAVQAT